MSDVDLPKQPWRRIYAGLIEWDVFELASNADERASLIFDSTRVVRRVRNYPPNWLQLDDASLAKLLDAL